MTLNQRGKRIGFAKSHQRKGIWWFFSPDFEPKSNNMVKCFVNFTLNSR